MRIERLQQEYLVEIEYVHFPLHPETPPEGMRLLDLFGGESARPRLEASQVRLKALADEQGLPISPRTMTYNSRLAQEVGAWAEEQGKGLVFHDLAYRAYFVDNRNLYETEVLVDLAGQAGLDPDEARKVVETRSHRAAVDADWQRSRADGVNAVPTFSAGGQQARGAHPYEVLEQLVLNAGAVPRSASGGSDASGESDASGGSEGEPSP